MTKYYIGYKQGNNEYVYISEINYNNVRITTLLEGAFSFDNIETARGLLNVANKIVLNQSYSIYKITTDIEEVKE